MCLQVNCVNTLVNIIGQKFGEPKNWRSRTAKYILLTNTDRVNGEFELQYFLCDDSKVGYV